MPTLAKFTWGQGYGNTLTVAYPPDKVRAWSAPRPTSSHARSDAGVEVIWHRGLDHWLDAEFTFLPNRATSAPVATGYDGPDGWTGMVAWSNAGQQVRFHPDANNMNNYLLCDIVAPFGDEPALEKDGTYRLTARLRSTERPFSQAIAGLLFEYKPGQDIRLFGGSFTRSGSTATYVGADGYLKSAAANELRHEWLDLDDNAVVDAISTLIEPARTNLFLQSGDPNNAAWVKSNVSITGANTILAPDGALTGDKVTELATNTTHQLSQVIAVTNGQAYSISTFFKPAERTDFTLRLSDGGSTNYFQVAFTSGTPAVTPSAGGTGAVDTASAGYRKLKNGWYRIWVTGTVAWASATLHHYISNAGLTYLGVVNSGCYFWGSQLELGTGVTSYIPTSTTSIARGADNLSFTVRLPVTGTITSYAKFKRPVWLAMAGTLDQFKGIFGYGTGAGHLEVYSSNTTRNVTSYGQDSATVVTSGGSAFVAGEPFEVTTQFADIDTGLRIRHAFLAGGFSAYTTTVNPVVAWNGSTLYVGWLGGSNHHHGNIMGLKIAAGAKTYAEMVAL